MPTSVFLTYAYPMDQSRRELAQKRDEPYPTMEEVRVKASEWKKLWNAHNENDRIIRTLTDLTGVTLPYPVEVSIIGGQWIAMSSPLIIPMWDKNNTPIDDPNFLQICVHELIHRFISPKENFPGIRQYWNKLQATHASESQRTRNHILVYALLKLVVPQFLGEDAWQACKHIILPDYQRAFDIMEEYGAEACLCDFTNCFKEPT